MGVDVETQVIIARPLADVAAFAADPANATRWYSNIVSATLVTPPPLSVGSRVAFEAAFLGKTMAYTYEVVEYEPPRRLVMRTAEGPFPMETTYSWAEQGPSATLMRLRNRGEPAGFSRLARPLMSGAIRRANERDLAALKELLESDGA